MPVGERKPNIKTEALYNEFPFAKPSVAPQPLEMIAEGLEIKLGNIAYARHA